MGRGQTTVPHQVWPQMKTSKMGISKYVSFFLFFLQVMLRAYFDSHSGITPERLRELDGMLGLNLGLSYIQGKLPSLLHSLLPLQTLFYKINISE